MREKQKTITRLGVIQLLDLFKDINAVARNGNDAAMLLPEPTASVL
jgi:hypothetical protein